MSDDLQKLDQINEKISAVQVDVAKISICTQVNTRHLDEHIKRTNLLEKKLEQIEQETDETRTEVRSAKKGVGYLVGLLGITSTVLGIIYILGKLS